MIKITDEMVEKAAKAALDRYNGPWAQASEALRSRFREEAIATLQAVAPLIAKAEAEACAEIVGKLKNHYGDLQSIHVLEKALIAIRARHAS